MTASATPSSSITAARDLDASLLLIPQLGFLPPEDPRVRGTIEAIERELVCDGFVCRYPTRPGTDGLPSGEGVFLACSFWLANSLSLIGRRNDAVKLFERLLAVRNDLGLLSEEYDPRCEDGCSAISRRPSRISRSSIPRRISPRSKAPRQCAAIPRRPSTMAMASSDVWGHGRGFDA